ncbi:hypothetical protein HanHA300_Chr01g0020581 [Helianthus annuus]|nr:hypothetical protein HanHA300_Chr01g0020581 [Helianthus annuus]
MSHLREHTFIGEQDKLTARALAESPSVRINVQLSELFVAAKLASSSLGMLSFPLLLPSVFFKSFCCLNCTHETTRFTISDFATAKHMTIKKNLTSSIQNSKKKKIG